MNTEISSLSAISHLLLHKPRQIVRIVVAPNRKKQEHQRIDAIVELAKSNGVTLDLSGPVGENTAPVRAWIKPFEYAEFSQVLEQFENAKSAMILALDHLQDPQNFGALVRTAEALGVQAILIPKDRSVLVGSGVYHASVGAVETIPVVLVTNLGEAIRKMKTAGAWVLGAALGPDSHPLETTPNFDKKVLVMGSEWEGLSPLIQKLCDWLVEIPLAGRVESLNVSAAGAILLYELLHPRT